MNRLVFFFVLLLVSIPAMGRSTSAGVRGTLLPVSETATAGPSACLADTTQADFAAGVPTNIDLISSPGDATLLAPSVIDQQNTTVGVVGGDFSSTVWYGQTFTPSVSGILAEIEFPAQT